MFIKQTSEDAVEDDFHVFSEEVSIVEGSQGKITGDVPTELFVVTAQEIHHHRDSHGHHSRFTVMLKVYNTMFTGNSPPPRYPWSSLQIYCSAEDYKDYSY